MNHWHLLQAQRNADSRAAWELFAPHRQRVTQLLGAAADQYIADGHSPSLSVLGAGNGNDLDLQQLLTQFATIQLIDIDVAALNYAVAQQDCVDLPAVTLRGGIDLSGAASQISKWTRTQPPTESAIEDALRAVREAAPQLPANQDVVISVCLLSQLLESFGQGLAADHSKFLEFIAAIRLRHLQLMLQVVKPSGTVILVTDFVSSDTCPELLTATPQQLSRIVAAALESQNFFTGLHPGIIHRLLQTEATLAPFVREVRVCEPWVWDLGPRSYAVTAFVVRRS